jgi:hypothetical protein
MPGLFRLTIEPIFASLLLLAGPATTPGTRLIFPPGVNLTLLNNRHRQF